MQYCDEHKLIKTSLEHIDKRLEKIERLVYLIILVVPGAEIAIRNLM